MFKLEEVRLQFYVSRYCTNKLPIETLINQRLDVTTIPKLSGSRHPSGSPRAILSQKVATIFVGTTLP